jgi:acetylornithine/N-succinyldiaminopimelate aminotransferase
MAQSAPQMPDIAPDAAPPPLMDNYAYQDVTFVRGEGCRIWDDRGRAYLDFMGGVGSLSLGHAHPGLTRVISHQIKTLAMASGAFHTPPRTGLARALVAHCCADRVCFANSGTEAVEGALKLARRWSYQNKGPQAVNFIAFSKAYHGRSYGALSVTQKAHDDPSFGPYLPGVAFAPFNDLGATEALADADTTAAIIVEPLQGDGGLDAADPAFLHGLRALADARRIPLIFDEVQCGMGRLGTLFAHEAFGVEPDIVAISKALGGGVPIGAFLAKEAFAQVLTPGTHGSTAAGSALTCAAALEVINTLTSPGFLANVRAHGAQLREGLEAIARDAPGVVRAKGMGLMQGLELADDPAPVRRAILDAGLVTTQAGARVIRLLPPLVVTQGEIAEALDILRGVLVPCG